MASASPAQQSAARGMKNYRHNKSPKPGKIDRHCASIAKRLSLRLCTTTNRLRGLIQKIRTLEHGNVRKANTPLLADLLSLRKATEKVLGKLIAMASPSTASAFPGGGNGTSKDLKNSVTDPPNANPTNQRFLNKTLETGLRVLGNRGLEKLALVAGATGLAGVSSADPIVDVEFFQAGDQSDATFYLQNADSGVTYDSGVLKFEAILGGVAQSVKDNNSDYADKSLGEIMGEWDVTVRTDGTGEVYDGWSAAVNGPVLDLTHGPGWENFDYDGWLSSTSQDEMAVTVDFNDQLDFNHNNQYDPGFEALVQAASVVSDGFTGVVNQDNVYSTDVNSLDVIPEPAVMGLVLGAGVSMLAAKRFFGPKY